jgi:hypothetical protein
MRYERQRPTAPPRRGVVLLIVIALLALFASVGLAFVFYAESEANAAQLCRQGTATQTQTLSIDMLANYAHTELIYGSDNPYSAMRGIELARSIYGANPYGGNDRPFAGLGRFHNPYAAGPLNGYDDYQLVNYQYYATDGFLRDPEFVGARPNPTLPLSPGNYRAGNAPYTYNDLNMPILAAVTADGVVLKQSLYTGPDFLWYKNAAHPVPPPNWTGVVWDPTNPNFANGVQKYLTFSPHWSWNPEFHSPGKALPDADEGGHVKNLESGKGTLLPDGTFAKNDSFWTDLGFPVQTAANGKRYKPLFAFLVMDLDNRLHLMVTGNQNNKKQPTPAPTHISNLGYGPSEANLSVVVQDPNELQRLFDFRWGPPLAPPVPPPSNWKGYPQQPDYRPYAFPAPPPWYPARWPNAQGGPAYARVDFDGVNGGQYALPAGFSIFPTFPGWFNPPGGPNADPDAHPLGYHYFTPQGDDAKLDAANMEFLLRYKGKNSASTSADLITRLGMSNTFVNSPNAARTRNLVTLLSWQFDRVHASPYIDFDPSAGASDYSFAAAPALYPTAAGPRTSPPVANPPTPNTDFAPDFRSALARQLRVDLNSLPDYPQPDGNGVMDPVQAANATQARQNMAQRIYKLLVQVTGAPDPNNGGAGAGPGFEACRWLAQLAVNIVDYSDNDDAMTAFNWYPASGTPEWVYGTETPRLVINEAYAQVDNDPTDTNITDPNPANWTTATKFKLNSWVELHNPFMSVTDPVFPYDGGQARLIVNDPNGQYAAYQVVVGKYDANLRNNRANNEGNTSVSLATVQDWWDGTGPNQATQTTVLPANGNFNDAAMKNNGFYVLGAQATYAASFTYMGNTYKARDPQFPAATRSTSNMSRAFDMTNPQDKTDMNDVLANGTTILLRRLANPYLQPQANPALPNYNPYVTVDYVEKIPTNENRIANDTTAGPIPFANVKNPDQFSSVGRRQPYGAGARVAQQWPNRPNNTVAPNHTFFQQNAADATNPNGTLTQPFDWLVHLDRAPVNAVELMNVSGYRPFELTQQFIVYDATFNPTAKWQHVAPWEQTSTRIYRALEGLGVGYRDNGSVPGGRGPGRVNLNTLRDIEVWQALCDPQAVSNFNAATVNGLFGKLMQSRTVSPLGVPTPTWQAPGAPPIPPGPVDRPFKSFAVGETNPGDVQYPMGSGLPDTLLRDDPTAPGTKLLKLNLGGHPYKDLELLQKLYNNVGFTSNGFAVWVTVGFFEVVDESVQPPRLGKELGRDENKHVRHRMFAIVDRSELALVRVASAAPIGAGPGVTIPVRGALINDIIGKSVEIGPDPSTGLTEIVNVQAAGLDTSVPNNPVPWIKADVSSNYSAGTPIVYRGNPGPQPRTLRAALKQNQAAGINQSIPLVGTVTTALYSTVPPPAGGVKVDFVDPTTGAVRETVTVSNVSLGDPASSTPPAILASLNNAHPAGTLVIWRDPTQYNARSDRLVVPHMTIID